MIVGKHYFALFRQSAKQRRFYIFLTTGIECHSCEVGSKVYLDADVARVHPAQLSPCRFKSDFRHCGTRLTALRY